MEGRRQEVAVREGGGRWDGEVGIEFEKGRGEFRGGSMDFEEEKGGRILIRGQKRVGSRGDGEERIARRQWTKQG